MKFLKAVLYEISMFFLILTSCSCASNKYAEFYVENPRANGQHLISETDPLLVEIENVDEVYDWEQDGYCVIGTSSFYSTWVPRTCAIDCAEKYGASHVLVFFQRGEKKQNSVTYNIPTTKTTTHYGTIYGANGSANYSGTSTTYGSTPVTINYTDQYYSQAAFFLAKRNKINSYGVYLSLPENTPGKSDKFVRVSVVIKGSSAERDGIRRGDRVKKINGISINEPEQVQDFIDGLKEIESMEVEHE